MYRVRETVQLETCVYFGLATETSPHIPSSLYVMQIY